MDEKKNRAVFLDRDGVINNVIDRGENFFVQGKEVRWTAPFNFEEFKINSGVEKTLKRIGDLGYLRILVTNQPDVTYGTLSIKDHERIMAEIKKLPLDDIFVCTHGRDDGCDCKKPKPGMLLQAAEKHNIDLVESFIIGDTSSDIKAGQAVGCATILLAAEYNQEVEADYKVAGILEAIEIIKNLLTF